MHGKKTIWLVGRSSRLGAAIEAIFKPDYNNILIGTDIEDVDITNLSEVEDFAEKINPDIIVDCAMKRNKKWCEDNPEEAYAIHALGARNLAIVANAHGADLFYLSSDFVFDGSSSKPYNEFDDVRPITVYGRSKVAGENFVRNLCPQHTILRSSWLYGKRYLNEILDSARKGKVTIYQDIIGSPTSSLELAETVIRFFDSNQYGTFHISCEGEASMKEFVLEILKIAKINAEIEIGGSPTSFEELRARYSVLDNMMLRLIKEEPMNNWRESLRRFMEERKVVK